MEGQGNTCSFGVGKDRSPLVCSPGASSSSVGEREGGGDDAGKKGKFPRMIVTRARARRGQEHLTAGNY